MRCTFPGVVNPDEMLRLEVDIGVNEPEVVGTLTNKAEVSGGGALTVSTEAKNRIGLVPAPFGVSSFSFFKAGLNGLEERQAGGHPYELTTTIDLNNVLREEDFYYAHEFTSVEDVKDIVVDLPLGFAGSTLAAPECTLAQLGSLAHCPPDTIVGHLFTEPENAGTNIDSPIWNLVPERGHPAEFGYIDTLKGPHVAGVVSVVPTPAGYVLRFTAAEIPQVDLTRIVVTFYGDPAKRLYEATVCTAEPEPKGRFENNQCSQENPKHEGHFELKPGSGTQVPFFTNPTACSNGPQVATIWMDSWQHPAQFSAPNVPANLEEEAGGKKLWVKAESKSPPVTGCNALQFTPEIGSQPTTHEADKPTGLEFEQRLPQVETFGVNATPALKDTTIVFPQGMTVDPSSADGLGTCSDAQIGYESQLEHPTLFDFTLAPPACPESSKIGTLELETPLIPGKLYGEVFLAAQNENPFHSTFATYIVVNDPITGVVLKLAGELKADPSTGQLTAVFDETPQLPFSDLKVHFFGGPRAELATPPNCGIYTTNSVLEPWSAPDSGLSPTPFDNYVINENCAIGFDPAFTGGSTNLQAGAYTTFQASFERQDDDQELQGAEVSLPPGLLANITSVTECGAAELAAEAADAPSGGCPASSQVGTVEAGAGPGPNPLFVPGKVFWTGPYNGGPFGLAVVVSANPGPFHFGNVLVRQSIRVNPLTAAVTDVSDPFPTYLDPVGPNGQTTGIPIKLRRVDVEINRAGFAFNPTNCVKEQFKVGGAITSVGGASKTLSTPFQVTNCGHLKFEPKVAASTQGKTSKADGASLTYKVAYPYNVQGTSSNIKQVKVELPKALPSRLTTLQKACTQAQFQANPAGCPGPSLIGRAKAVVPNIPVPLEGPVYFVSNGGEAFPNLVMVLQGDGVTVDLIGDTFISKSGITSTTFHAIPDNPVTSFEVTLPEGKYSALAANGNLCTQKLVIPNEYVSQSGITQHFSTSVSVTGCPKVKALTRAQKLKAALKACKKKPKGKRAACEAAARKQFGPVKAKKKKGRRG